MGLLTLTIAAIAIVMLIMAVGVILKRPCLRGSCGGPEIFDADGDPLSCGACPRRKEHQSRVSSTGAEGDPSGLETSSALNAENIGRDSEDVEAVPALSRRDD